MASNTIEYLLRVKDDGTATLKSIGGSAEEAGAGLDQADAGAQSMTASMIKAQAIIAGAVVAFQALKAATVGLALGAIQAGAQMEGFHTRLTVLMGSAGAAQERLDELFLIGSTTPFEMPGLIEAEVNLRALGVSAEDNLPLIMDFAGAMGVDVASAAVEVGRAMQFGAGAVETISGRALRAQVELRTGQDALKMSTDEFRQALIDTLTDPEGIFAGGTEKLAATFDGLMSNLSDAWFGFQKTMADADLFTNSKATLKAFLEFMKANQGIIDDFAKAIGSGIGGALLQAAFLAAFMVDTIHLAALDLEKTFGAESIFGKLSDIGIAPDMLDILGAMGLGQIEQVLRIAGAINEVSGASEALTGLLGEQAGAVLGDASAVKQLEEALALAREQMEKFGEETRTRGIKDTGVEGDEAVPDLTVKPTVIVMTEPSTAGDTWELGMTSMAEERNNFLTSIIANTESLLGGTIPGGEWWAQLINFLAGIGDEEYDLNWEKLGKTIHDAFVGAVKLWFSLDALFTTIIDGIAFGIRDAVQLFMDDRNRWSEPDQAEQSKAINEFNAWIEDRSFQIGTKFVDRTGLALLHRGETVTPAGGATPQRAFGGSGAGGLVVNVNAPLGIGPGTAEQLVRELNQVLGARGLNLSIT